MAGTRLAKFKKTNAVNRYGVRYYRNGFLRLLDEFGQKKKHTDTALIKDRVSRH